MKALIVVDVQYDFMPVSEEDYKNKMGGALAVPNGNEIVPVINKLLPMYELVIFTKDWHPEGMNAFASAHEGKKPFDKYTLPNGEEDTLWPDHCIAESRGSDLHDDIDFSKIRGDFYIIKKGMEKNYHPYSGFGKTELEEFLKEKNVDEVCIVGLALDYCVRDTAIDAAKAGFTTTIIKDGTRAIAEDLSETYEILYNHNVNFVESWELPLYNLL